MEDCRDIAFSNEYEDYIGRRLFGLSDFAAAEDMGVLKLRRQPYLNLYGKGIVFGIADTGIDYTHPVFRNEDGSSRILAIWDQSAQNSQGEVQTAAESSGTGTVKVPYGSVYLKEEIDRALRTTAPLELVPVTDEIGHGTFMAGLAAGNIVESEEFTGIAPQADLVVVKLREAGECLKDFWFIPPEVPAYEEKDVSDAVEFLATFARRREEPVTIFLGLGSNMGDHNGTGTFANFLSLLSMQPGMAVVISGGNEGNAAHHYRGISQEGQRYQDVEVRVASEMKGFYLEFWAEAPDLYGIGFVSPTGEYVEKLPIRIYSRETITFAFEPTVVYVTYQRVERVTGETLIQMRFVAPTPGIWKVRIFQEETIGGRFDLWLPIAPFLEKEVSFLRPDPDTTITEPGNAEKCITVTAYSQETSGIYLNSSRGYTRSGQIKPDFVAPGVNVLGPIRGGLYTRRSGSSVAAALTAGLVIMLEEYNPSFSGVQIGKYLIRGARRGNMTFPNVEFGYGIVDIYRTFETMRITSQ